MTGSEFYAWRTAAKMTLFDVQVKTGVHAASVSRFENGKDLTSSSYQRLIDFMNGVDSDANNPNLDKQAKIIWHIRELDRLVNEEKE